MIDAKLGSRFNECTSLLPAAFLLPQPLGRAHARPLGVVVLLLILPQDLEPQLALQLALRRGIVAPRLLVAALPAAIQPPQVAEVLLALLLRPAVVTVLRRVDVILPKRATR